MGQDPYEAFAERYDLSFGPFDEHDVRKVSFFRELFTHHHVHRVLDCACGTGRDLALFHSLGCDVMGSDISLAMLAQAERNLASHHISATLEHIDYRELSFRLATEFDAVVCLSSAFFEMPDEIELRHAFASMRDILHEGGLLVLSAGMCDRTWRERPRFVPEVNRVDFTRLFVIDYFDRGARFNVVDLHHGDGDKDMKVWSIEYERVYLRDDIEAALQSVGFRKYSFYGSYEFQPYDKEMSGMLVAVAIK
ncbi:MAG: class I SAM-dependent methyltransferase [Dehalococcoidia bacterium]|nr:class I SAM-dependent methyltransferase [Dehalococcoidia bacterium]